MLPLMTTFVSLSCASADPAQARPAPIDARSNVVFFVGISVSFYPFTLFLRRSLRKVTGKVEGALYLNHKETEARREEGMGLTQHSLSRLLSRGFDLRPRGRTPDSQLILARRDKMIAIGSEGQVLDRFFVPLEGCHLLA